MARLGDDPAIVTVYDVGEEADGTPFIVSQFIAGGSLDQRLDQEPIGSSRSRPRCRLATQSRGLARTPSQIRHRDVKDHKTSGSMLTGAARLSNFEFHSRTSKRVASPPKARSWAPSPVRAGAASGTTRTRVRTCTRSVRMIYEMLCGRPPFLGDDMVYIIKQHLDASDAPRYHNSDVPVAVETLVLRLLREGPHGTASKSTLRCSTSSLPRRTT